MLNNNFYRADIDGLRAIAVLLVIFFHAGFEPFSGGFVGVDIFFVISGYLITNILIRDINSNIFTFRNFYLRRAKRILPALVVVTFFCTPLSVLFFSPENIKDFSQSVIFVSIFSSNLLFWMESGYFDTASELKPLLHTWSLAVEEQFYILFPPFFLLLWKKKNYLAFVWVSIVALISLIYSIWASFLTPQSAFYLLPSRCWEILLGSLLAIVLRTSKTQFGHVYNQLLSLIGITLVITAALAYDRATPFPGYNALIPTIGTALILAFSTEDTLINKILSNKILVFLGLISYSAYLWHQPLFAFARYTSASAPSTNFMLSLCVLTFAIAFFSWRYVEQPIRKSSNNTRILIFLAIAIFVLIAFGICFSFDSSIKKISPKGELLVHTNYDMYDHMIQTECKYWWRPQVGKFDHIKFKYCSEKYEKAVIIYGDSHAMNLYNIYAKTDNIPFLIGISSGGCRYTDQMYDECLLMFDTVEFLIKKHSNNIQAAIYHQAGSQFLGNKNGETDYYNYGKLHGQGYTILQDEIDKVVVAMSHFNSSVKLIWIGPWTEPRNRSFTNFNPISVAAFENLESVIDLTLNKTQYNFSYVSLNRIFGKNLEFFHTENCLVYKDENHFSRCGELYVANKFGDKLLEYL